MKDREKNGDERDYKRRENGIRRANEKEEEEEAAIGAEWKGSGVIQFHLFRNFSEIYFIVFQVWTKVTLNRKSFVIINNLIYIKKYIYTYLYIENVLCAFLAQLVKANKPAIFTR